MPRSSSRAAEYRQVIADIGNAHIELAMLKTHGLEAEELMVLQDLLARAERKVLANLSSKK